MRLVSAVAEVRRLAPRCLARFASRALFLLSVVAFAASPMGDHEAYLDAVGQQRMQDRLPALELFASSTQTSILKIQALELMAWYYKQLGDEANANLWAKQLLTFDAENPLALAVLVENARRANPTAITAETVGFAERGLRRAERLEKPEGMSGAEFTQLREHMLGILHGTIGYAYFQQKDFANARGYLRDAVRFMPNDPQYVYALGLADLEGTTPNANEGYLYLAKAVNLTAGTPAGKQIAEYAANRYREEGGSSADWNKFLAAASPTAIQTSPAIVAKNVPPQSSADAAKTAAAVANPVAPTAATPSASSRATATTEVASLPPPPPVIQRPPLSPRDPVSLGLLIEANIATREDRDAITFALVDMVRHLRNADEAFILSFGQQLEFQQDLTQNYDLLEAAMKAITPDEGAALLDAVGFSSGHLARIAKNRNRVLLVISDGRDFGSRTPGYEITGQIDQSGVRIYCIGLGVEDASGRGRLEQLAGRTGGRATFIRDPAQFRAAAHQIATGLGIDFPL